MIRKKFQPSKAFISAVKGFYFLEVHDSLGELEHARDMADKVRYSPTFSSKLTAHLQWIDKAELISYVRFDMTQRTGERNDERKDRILIKKEQFEKFIDKTDAI